MTKNEKNKRKLLKLLTISIAVLTGGQPALAAYTRRDVEAGIHFLEALEHDEGVDAALQELLDVTEDELRIQDNLNDENEDEAMYEVNFEVILPDVTDELKDLDKNEILMPKEEILSTFETPAFIKHPTFESTEESEPSPLRTPVEIENNYWNLNGLTREKQLEILLGAHDGIIVEFDEESGTYTTIEEGRVYNFPAVIEYAETLGGINKFRDYFVRAMHTWVENPALDEEGNQIYDYDYDLDSEGNLIFQTNGEDEYLLDEEGNRIPLLIQIGPRMKRTDEQIGLEFSVPQLLDSDELAALNGRLDAIDRVHDRFLPHQRRNHRHNASYSTTGNLSDAITDENYLHAPTKEALIDMAESDFLGTDDTRRHYSTRIHRLEQRTHSSTDSASYSRHFKADSQGNLLRFAPEDLEEMNPQKPADHEFAIGDIVNIELEGHSVKVSLIDGTVTYQPEYQTTNMGGQWASANTPGHSFQQTFSLNSFFPSWGFRALPEDVSWYDLNSENLDHYAERPAIDALRDAVWDIPLGESRDFVSILGGTNNAPTGNFPTSPPAYGGLAWMTLTRLDGEMGQDGVFTWSKYIRSAPNTSFSAVSYSTLIDEVFDKEFSTVKFFQPVDIDLPEGDFGVEDTNGNGSDDGNGDDEYNIIENPPFEDLEDDENGDNGTPPNGDNGDGDDDNIIERPPGDEQEDYENDGSEDLTTGAENVGLPKTGSTTSGLDLAGLAALGIGGTALAGKKLAKHKKNSKK